MRRGGAKSFVDDLVLGRGVVLSRAATSLRSIETQPWTRRFVRYCRRTHLRWSEVRVSKNFCQQIFSKFVGLFSTPLSFSPVCKGLARRDGVFTRGEGLFSTYRVPSPDGTFFYKGGRPVLYLLSFRQICKGLARRDGVFTRGEGLFSTYFVPSPDGTFYFFIYFYYYYYIFSHLMGHCCVCVCAGWGKRGTVCKWAKQRLVSTAECDRHFPNTYCLMCRL